MSNDTRGDDMTNLTLTDREELEPDDRPRRRSDDNTFVRYWLPFVLVAISLFGSGRDGFGWIFGRESKEHELEVQISRMQADIDQLRSDAVRKDIYSLTIQTISDRLASIDRKLSERR